MFDIGFSELVLIGVLALLVLGPKRLPEVARTAGRWMGRLRHYVSDVKRDFDREFESGELEELRNLKRELDETRRALADSTHQLMDNLAATDEPKIDAPAASASAKSTKSAKSRSKPRAAASRAAGKKHGRRPKSGR